MSETRVGRQKLSIVPCTRSEGQAFVLTHHRHHKPPVSGICCVACVDESGLVRGVAMVGRPVARASCDGRTVEVNRVATDGCPNACSFLLGACRRIAFELGYTEILTYTLPAEGGASLRGAGWSEDGVTPGRSWDVPSRRRVKEAHPLGKKVRWVSMSRKRSVQDIVWPDIKEQTDQIHLFAGATS